MTQAKSKGSTAVIKMAKIDYIWSRLKGAKYFPILDIRSGYHISIYPDSGSNQLLLVHMENSSGNE